MRHLGYAWIVVAAFLLMMGEVTMASYRSPSAGPDPAAIAVDLELVMGGVRDPVAIGNAGDGSGRLFVLEKTGRVRIIADGQLLDDPFLDIRSRVVRLSASYDERGLLGIAFHPDYKTNGRFFVYYSAPLRPSAPNDWDHTGHLSEFHVSAANPNQADPNPERIRLLVDEPQSNHNGGQLAFGPDGYLYVSLGDGGQANDQGTGHNERIGNGQDGRTLLGKLLRIDVDKGNTYTIPPDNPFVENPDFEDEIWAYGLRNSWRFSFDRATKDLYIGDVGQNAWEEVDFQPAGDRGGQNYGWRIMEGSHCFNPSSGCRRQGLTLPVAEYSHSGGNCSVTGGYVYRGQRYPALVGAYFYGDYCSGTIWALARDDAGQWHSAEVGDAGFEIQSFGEGEDGEIYVAGSNGQVMHLVDKNAPAVPTTPVAPTDTPAPPTDTPIVPTDTPIVPTHTSTSESPTPVEPTPTAAGATNTPHPTETPFIDFTRTPTPTATPEPIYLPYGSKRDVLIAPTDHLGADPRNAAAHAPGRPGLSWLDLGQGS